MEARVQGTFARKQAAMEYGVLGRTGLRISRLGFGCGNVGGLMVRGTPADQERAVARAVDLGVTYFDTAPMYGNGQSETNLGRVLATLRPEIVLQRRRRQTRSSAAGSARRSPRRWTRACCACGASASTCCSCTPPSRWPAATARSTSPPVIEEVIPAFESLRAAGKIGFYGFSGTGEAAALPRLIDTGSFDLFQVIYNILNPTAADATAPHVGPNYANVLARATAQRMGAVGIRVLAGGALSGVEERPPSARMGPCRWAPPRTTPATWNARAASCRW